MFSKYILLLLGCGFCEVLAVVNKIHLPYPKTCSCGVDNGGEIVQSLTRKFKFIDGAIWNNEDQRVCFVDKLGGTINTYDVECGETVTMHIKELKDKDVSAIFAIKGRKHEYVVAANQTLYLLKLEHDENEELKYTIKEIMHVLNDSQMFSTATTTMQGCIIIGTKPKDYENTDESNSGNAEVLRVDMTTQKVEVIDSGYTFIGGVAFDYHYQRLYVADIIMGQIWCHKYNTTTGIVSDKKMIFDTADHVARLHGNITAIVVDREGLLWIGMMRSYEVIVFDPMFHRIIRAIPIPSSVMGSFAWGGKHFDVLFAGTVSTFPVRDPHIEPASGRLLGISGTGGRGWEFQKVIVSDDVQ